MSRRYVVVGAGAIGGVVGARLFQHGHDTVLVARGEHGRAVRRAGLRVIDPDADAVVPVPAVERADELELGPADVVLLAVKSQDTAGALGAVAAVASPETPIFCVQNGVANERTALRRFASVYGVCVFMPCSHVEPGVVVAYSGPVAGVLDLGRFPSGTNATASAVAADLNGSGLASRAEPAIMRRKYHKLLANLTNAAEAMSGPTARTGPLADRVRREGRACLAAAGIDVASEEEDAARRVDLSMRPVSGRPYGGGSSWQSLARGAASIEADYLNGEIVLLGRLHGVPTPVNAMLQRLANEAVARGAPPGSIPLADLEAMAG